MSNRKLVLTRETLRILDRHRLEGVVAGALTEDCNSNGYCPNPAPSEANQVCDDPPGTKASRGVDCTEGGTVGTDTTVG